VTLLLISAAWLFLSFPVALSLCWVLSGRAEPVVQRHPWVDAVELVEIDALNVQQARAHLDVLAQVLRERDPVEAAASPRQQRFR
jgi:hypothetical protein